MKNLIPKRVMEYIIITFAVVLMDVGIYVFKFPNNFSFGGVSGMAVVFSHFIPMTSAQINLVINLILLVIGFIVLGRDFGVKTAYVTVVSSLLLNVFEKVFPMDRALTGNIMLELCFAIILPALAAALLFFENASGGGTDIVAMIIKKYSTMNISGALFAVDCVIVVVSDSFHACVFSILFHKPFVVVGNKERGLARVKSLLKMFGLEKCLYENQELGMTNLNWNLVEERLYEWRKKSFSLINKL